MVDKYSPCGNDCSSGDGYPLPEWNRDKFEELTKKPESLSEHHLRFYTLTTVELKDNRIHVNGSAPNFQGDILTLCTCKRDMRSTLLKNYWKKKTDKIWIAAFVTSTPPKINGEDYPRLLYLAKVKQIHKTFKKAWLKINPSVRRQKSTLRDPQGDLYEPEGTKGKTDWFDSENYKTPDEHCHTENQQRKDIENGSIFVFDRENTFIFGPKGLPVKKAEKFDALTDHPGYLSENKRHGRWGQKTNLQDFIRGIVS